MDNAVDQRERHSVDGALRSIKENVPDIDPTASPAQFVLAIGRSWKERGGTVAGKPRHSDRQLNELLKKQGTIVKSLTPKLAGRTKLKRGDASALLRLFLSHWDYVGDYRDGDSVPSASEGDPYSSLLTNDAIEDVSRYIVARMSEDGLEARAKTDLTAFHSMTGENTAKLIAEEFRKADAMFTVSADQILVVAKPSQILVGFRDILSELFAIDEADGRERILVWILDLGTLDFRDYEARSRFLNVEMLASRFKALKLFKEEGAQARWNWLRSRTVIVLHNPGGRGHEVAGLSAFTTHHFLFGAVPPNWAKSSQFRALYGERLERLDESSYSIFLSRSVENSDNVLSDLDGERNFRYFGHAQFTPDDKDDRQVRGLRLPGPGRDYDSAFRTIYAAAAHVLGIGTNLTHTSIDGRHAIEALSGLGFSILRLDEFMNL
jgi:hypothetical protein